MDKYIIIACFSWWCRKIFPSRIKNELNKCIYKSDYFYLFIYFEAVNP